MGTAVPYWDELCLKSGQLHFLLLNMSILPPENLPLKALAVTLRSPIVGSAFGFVQQGPRMAEMITQDSASQER